VLRGVDHQELVSAAATAGNLERELTVNQDAALQGVDLGEMFGIDLAKSGPAAPATKAPSKKPRAGRKPATKKPLPVAVAVTATIAKIEKLLGKRTKKREPVLSGKSRSAATAKTSRRKRAK
jgi:hypothetical protein